MIEFCIKFAITTPPIMEKNQYSIFESELRVRPDDIDMFNHVHNSKYLDYVLAARYEQMEKFYGMSWETFEKLGYKFS